MNKLLLTLVLALSCTRLYSALPDVIYLTIGSDPASEAASMFEVGLRYDYTAVGTDFYGVLEIKKGIDGGWDEWVVFASGGSFTTAVSANNGTVTGGVATLASGIVVDGTGVVGPVPMVKHLKKSAVYYFRIALQNTQGQYLYSNVQSVQFDGTADVTRPAITTLPSASGITGTSGIASWGTGEASDSRLVYGPLSTPQSYPSSVALDTNLVTSHVMTVSGLTPGGSYAYKVASMDTNGNGLLNNTSNLGTFTTTASVTATGTYIVQRGFGGTAYQANCHPVALAEDSAGNVTMCGNFQLTVNFGGGDLIATPSASQGADMFIANYSSVLAHNWSKRIGGDLEDGANSVAADSANNVLVIGHYKGTVDFGGVTLTNAGGSDIFVAKFNGTNGALIWAKRFGGTGTDIGRALVLDSANNILITGTYGFYGSGVDFGGGVLPLAGATDTQVFVAKLNSSGGYAWANGYGGTGLDQPNAIAVNTANDVVVIGDYQLTMNLGGTNMTSAGGRDVFIAKYDGDDGAHLWSRSGGGTGEDLGKGVGFDPSGNVAVNGEYRNTNAHFGGSYMVSDNGLPGMFVAKYSSSGAHTWSRGFSLTGPTSSISAKGLAVDSLGNIVVTGGVAANANFDGIYIGYGTPSVMLVKFNSSGLTTWAHFYDGPQNDFGAGVRIGASNRILVTGNFAYSINFGGGLMESPGGFDGFIAKFTP